jgi:hypothetical protein
MGVHVGGQAARTGAKQEHGIREGLALMVASGTASP